MKRNKQNKQTEALSPFVPRQEPKEKPGEFAANIGWLHANWKNYINLWVALNNGALLCCGDTEEDIMSQIKTHPNRINILSLKVGTHFGEQLSK